MKLLLTGDFHLGDKKPSKRTDQDYITTLIKKLRQILEICVEEDCYAILQPGDFFDSSTVSDYLKNLIIKTLNNTIQERHLFTIHGQHDQRYHSTVHDDTSLSVLDAANVVTHLIPEPFRLPGNVYVYGASWGVKVPTIPDELKDKINILVIHKTFVENTEDYNFRCIPALPFLKEHKFDLVVSGDNHKTFTVTSGNRTLVNAGSLVRTSIDQYNHRPCIFIYETKTKKITKKFLSVEKPEKVFVTTDSENELQKQSNEGMIRFADEIKGNVDLKNFDFISVVRKLAGDVKELKTILEEITGVVL